MPGLVGIISKRPRKENEHDLRVMMSCMMHEPFYVSGTYLNDRLNIYAGWICHRESFSDCLPILNEENTLVLLFSGENFADSQLINGLKRKGHEFDSSNASYLIHLYEEEGEKFTQHLNGWFSGILIDLRKEKASLFNDRYGMQRIYYHEAKDSFYFSSEAKALLKINPELRKINARSLGELFSCGCALEDRTIFSNISLLPGGSFWSFQTGNGIMKEKYFEPLEWEIQPPLEKEIFYNRLKETFTNILPKYFCSKEPIAMSLTGGLDTRMILSCMEHPPDKLPCYTFGDMYRDSLDVIISRKVAQECRQPHYALILDTKFLADFQNHAEKTIYISDGCLDACGSYELYLNRLARKVAPIRMTGNYGGEVLRGVRAFKAIVPDQMLFNPDFKKYILEAIRTFAEVSKAPKLSFTLFKQAPWYGYGRLSIEQSQLTLRTPYMDNNLMELMYQAPPDVLTSNEISLRIISDGTPNLSKILTDRGAGGVSNYFSMFVRLYYEFLFKAEYYYNHGMPHWLSKLDNIFAQLHLERLFLGHHKFHHFRIWFRNELSDYVRDILFDDRTASRPYLNNEYFNKMVSNHIKGDQNYTNEINMVLTVELIHRLLIEDSQ